MKAIIAAAGTGGHINPAIAIANKIMEKEPDSKIVFIGTPRGLENDLVPRAGYELRTIDVYGIKRKLDLDNLKRLRKIRFAIKDVRDMIKDIKPDVMIGTGGYICVAVAVAAQREKVPVILHESNAFPGIAIKLLANKSAKVLLGFEDAKERIIPNRNTVVTGTPTKITKNRLTSEEKLKIRNNLKLNAELPIVLVFGGSQGAKTINNAIIGIIEKKLNKNYQILWAAGKKNYEDVKNELQSKNIDIDKIQNTKILPYIYNMQEAMEISDVIVARSGAMTITEISQIGRPAIFIPYPFATENHQEYNAKVLEKKGAARIILDKNLTYDALDKEIRSIVNDKKIIEDMGKRANKISRNDVEEIIYKEIKNVVNRK